MKFQGVSFFKYMVFVAFSVVATQVLAFDVKRHKLENGMELVVIPDNSVPQVSTALWCKCGAAFDPEGKSGLAYLTEYIIFKGKNRTGEVSSLIAKNGGVDNAVTQHDYTVFYQDVPSSRLETSLRTNSERVSKIFVDDKVIKSDIDALVKRKEYIDENIVTNQLSEKMQAVLFRKNPYSRPALGNLDEVQKLTASDVTKFFNDFYVPQNMKLVIVGDVDFEQAKSLTEKYFGANSKKGKPVDLGSLKIDLATAQTIEMEREGIRNKYFIRYYSAPNYEDSNKEDVFTRLVIAEFLGGGKASKLYTELVSKRHLALDVTTSYDPVSLGDTTFAIVVTLDPKADILEVQRTVDSALNDIFENGMKSEEIAYTKNILNAKKYYDLEDFESIALKYGRLFINDISEDYLNKWHENVDSVNFARIKSISGVVFHPDKAVTGYLIPKKEQGL